MRRFLWIVLPEFYLAVLPAAADARHLNIEDVRAMAFDKGIVALKRSSSTTACGRSRARCERQQDRGEG